MCAQEQQSAGTQADKRASKVKRTEERSIFARAADRTAKGRRGALEDE